MGRPVAIADDLTLVTHLISDRTEGSCRDLNPNNPSKPYPPHHINKPDLKVRTYRFCFWVLLFFLFCRSCLVLRSGLVLICRCYEFSSRSTDCRFVRRWRYGRPMVSGWKPAAGPYDSTGAGVSLLAGLRAGPIVDWDPNPTWHDAETGACRRGCLCGFSVGTDIRRRSHHGFTICDEITDLRIDAGNWRVLGRQLSVSRPTSFAVVSWDGRLQWRVDHIFWSRPDGFQYRQNVLVL